MLPFESGTTMRAKIPAFPHPSMRAASNNSCGNWSKNTLKIQMAVGRLKATFTSTSQYRVLISPMLFPRLYRGMSTVMGGTIRKSSARRNSVVFPMYRNLE